MLQVSPDMIGEVCAIQTETDVDIPAALNHDAARAKTKPGIWWMCIKRSNKIIPASLASIGRIFSNFGTVQSKLRNRLGLQKAAKLVMRTDF